jgi:hypothetical protein
MNTAGTWYPPSCGTGRFLIELTNSPFTMTTHTDPTEPTTQTPELPPEVFAELLAEVNRITYRNGTGLGSLVPEIARLAYAAGAKAGAKDEYQRGADAELKAVCYWLDGDPCTPTTRGQIADLLRIMRGLKPVDLKEKALNDLSQIMSRAIGSQKGMFDGKPFATIRRALKSLPDPQ